MDKIDIILWVLSGGFGLMLVMWHNIHSRIDKIDEKLIKIDECLNPLETRMAIIETRLTDISHLMWHNQTINPKDIQEQ